MNFLRPWAIAIVSSALLGAGCSSKSKTIAEAPKAPAPERTATAVQPSAPVAPTAPVAKSEEEWFRTATLEELQARLTDIYFDYDLAQLRSDAKAAADENARWLTRPYNTVVVEVEGHCDERGTPDYNLALGERRSRSVFEYLLALGIPKERLRFVSFGKERPQCTDVSENCWWKNRRAHFRVASKGAGYSEE